MPKAPPRPKARPTPTPPNAPPPIGLTKGGTVFVKDKGKGTGKTASHAEDMEDVEEEDKVPQPMTPPQTDDPLATAVDQQFKIADPEAAAEAIIAEHSQKRKAEAVEDLLPTAKSKTTARQTPAATQPAATHPAATHLAASKPAATQPAATQAAAAQSEASSSSPGCLYLVCTCTCVWPRHEYVFAHVCTSFVCEHVFAYDSF